MGQKVLYSATTHNLTLAFQHEIGKNHLNQPLIHPNIQFMDGSLILDDENDELLITLLDSHKMNIENGGVAFRKQENSLLKFDKIDAGEVWCCEPEGGLQPTDIKDLEYLKRLTKGLPEKVKEKAAQTAIAVYKRFQIAGMPKPSVDNSIIILRGRIAEILEAISSEGIWKDGDDDATERVTDTGSNQKEN